MSRLIRPFEPRLNIIRNGLVHWFDVSLQTSYPGSGTSIIDLSGNGATGTLTNGPIYSSNNGGGIVLDGVNDYVEFNTDLNPEIGSEITVIVWAKISNFNIRNPLFIKYAQSGGFGYTFEVGQTSLWTRSMRFFSGSGSNSADFRGTIQLVNNTIYMFTLQFKEANYVNMYYNLNTMTVTDASTNFSSATNCNNGVLVRYGTYHPEFQIYGSPTIYSSMVYNRILTFSEITHNYNMTKSRFGL